MPRIFIKHESGNFSIIQMRKANKLFFKGGLIENLIVLYSVCIKKIPCVKQSINWYPYNFS